MNIPGSDILAIALSVITPQTVTYYPYASRTVDAVGRYEPVYDTPFDILGSFQPVPRSRYEAYGLDLAKNYCVFYTQYDIEGLDRDISGSQIVFGSDTYQVESRTNCFSQDGWVGLLVVRVDL